MYEKADFFGGFRSLCLRDLGQNIGSWQKIYVHYRQAITVAHAHFRQIQSIFLEYLNRKTTRYIHFPLVENFVGEFLNVLTKFLLVSYNVYSSKGDLSRLDFRPFLCSKLLEKKSSVPT